MRRLHLLDKNTVKGCIGDIGRAFRRVQGWIANRQQVAEKVQAHAYDADIAVCALCAGLERGHEHMPQDTRQHSPITQPWLLSAYAQDRCLVLYLRALQFKKFA